MYYRELGDTGLKVSEISFGTIPVLQGSIPVLPDYFNLDEKEALAVMEHAYQLGCNLYDTAIVPEYGDAEIKLGKFAELVGRDNIIISDKARFFGGSEMYQAVEVSCENLGTTPDIYFVHQVDADHEEEVFGRGGALDALAELKAERKIRYAGVATHYYDILLRGAQDDRVDVLQGSGNLLERGMLDRVREETLFRKKGFLVNKVYAAGLLPARFPVRTLIDFVLSYPVSSALIGLGTKEQVDAAMVRNAKEQETAIPSFEEMLSVLEKEYIPIPCDRCQRCVCPHGTEIHTLFRQYQYFHLGKDYWALKKLGLGIAESARQCRKCVEMSCMDACPGKIRIAQEMQKVERLVRDYPIGCKIGD
ncbi:MAG: aldo/keto reductase [Lachnospiraceae bacterium]|nr:aldo/keto reductase [Lachnospiraceae bacterium]